MSTSCKKYKLSVLTSTIRISRIEKTADSQINGFGFYEFAGKDYVVVAPFAGNVKVYDVDSLKLVQEISITSVVTVSVSPSNRFMVVGGAENAISVYELVTEGKQCKFQLRKTFGVLGTSYTAHWAPDDSCFAVSSNNGFAYLFSFKVTPNNDLDVQFVASYEVSQNFTKRYDDDELRGYVGLENVKFHPRPDKKIFAYAGAYVGHVYLVDYSTLQIVQTFAMPQEQGKLYKNFGVEFSPDGNNLYFTFTEVGGDKPVSQLVSLKLKGVSSLTDLSLKHIHKNKDNWHPSELQNTLPESLLEKISLDSKQ